MGLRPMASRLIVVYHCHTLPNRPIRFDTRSFIRALRRNHHRSRLRLLQRHRTHRPHVPRHPLRGASHRRPPLRAPREQGSLGHSPPCIILQRTLSGDLLLLQRVHLVVSAVHTVEHPRHDGGLFDGQYLGAGGEASR